MMKTHRGTLHIFPTEEAIRVIFFSEFTTGASRAMGASDMEGFLNNTLDLELSHRCLDVLCGPSPNGVEVEISEADCANYFNQ